MAKLTITTDLGSTDHYLAVLIGQLHRHIEQADILHVHPHVRAHDTRHGAFVVKNSYQQFPEKTIHLVHVNASEFQNEILIGEHGGHFFVTFNNGLLPLILPREHSTFYVLNHEFNDGSESTEVALARACSLLARGFGLADIAQPVGSLLELRWLQPVINGDVMRGAVVYIDHFGNAMLNITRQDFERHFQTRNVSVVINRLSVRELHNTYSDVDEGEIACFFNQSDLLEIAINKGKANHLLGLEMDSAVLLMAD